MKCPSDMKQSYIPFLLLLSTEYAQTSDGLCADTFVDSVYGEEIFPLLSLAVKPCTWAGLSYVFPASNVFTATANKYIEILALRITNISDKHPRVEGEHVRCIFGNGAQGANSTTSYRKTVSKAKKSWEYTTQIECFFLRLPLVSIYTRRALLSLHCPNKYRTLGL